MNPSQSYFGNLCGWSNGDRRNKGYAFNFANQPKPDKLITEDHLPWVSIDNAYPHEAEYIDSYGNKFTRMIGKNIQVLTPDGRIGGGWSTEDALKQADEHDFRMFPV